MQQGYFEKEFTLTPDYCDARAGLSPLGAFTIFQAIATEHAEKIGVGGAAMAKRGEFWLTVHSRIDFFGRAQLMQTLTAKTWPEGCDEKSIRCFRSYSLRCGDALVAMGRTQWAILGPEQKVVPFGSRASRGSSRSRAEWLFPTLPQGSATILRRMILCGTIPSVRRTLTLAGT